jgi:hypothetical protein
MFRPGLINAVASLRPSNTFSVHPDGSITSDDLEFVAPTTEEIQAELTRLQTEWDNAEYQRQRKPEYPPMEDYLDAVYWQSQGDNTKMTAYLAAVEAVKQRYPKGNV